ncbi:MAG TPA: hypothetical protein VFL91_02455 [Thermomicrobiales bacterium]|nr:hypothetical protein [Thermomicrobiales bacterium]
MSTIEERQRIAEADRLYEQFGKPLEARHAGRYVAISRDGRTIVGPTLLDVVRQARTAFGPGSYAFKVGERAVGRWR